MKKFLIRGARRSLTLPLLALLGLPITACGGGSSSPSDQAASSGSPKGPAGNTSSGGTGSQAGANSPGGTAHRLCGWIEAGNSVGEQSFIDHAESFDEIHPYWWQLKADGTGVVPAGNVDRPELLAAARAHGVRVIPLVFFENVAGLRAMLADSGLRAAHIAELRRLAQEHSYDGFEIDYEQLFQAADRPLFSGFMQALADALHADGKQLTAAIPALDGTSTDDAYDYAVLGSTLDHVHVMGYDFHGTFSDHAGPIAPLGWLRGVMAHVERAGHAERFILGLANYSVSPGRYYPSADAVRLCGGPGGYSSVDDHMPSCPLGHFEAGLAPHCSIGGALTYFEDLGSLAEKVQLAHASGLGGVAYYALGGEQAGMLETLTQ
jgi:hypothetical protein